MRPRLPPRPHVAAAALAVLALALSAASWFALHHPRVSPGRCEMTFMYSSFVRVPLPSAPSSSASSAAPGAGAGAGDDAGGSSGASADGGSSYDLYLYREDGFVEQS
jgi:hypothetical protein